VEQALLTGLVEDLRQDSADYAGFAAVYRDRERGADFLLALGSQESSGSVGPGASEEELTPGRAFQLVGRFARLETVRVSYDQITAAGISDVIGDPDLRRMIAEYYAAAEDRGEYSDALSQRLELSLREFGYIPSDGDPVPEAVLSNRVVRADIRSIRNDSRRAVNVGTRMLRLATDLMNAVEAHLR